MTKAAIIKLSDYKQNMGGAGISAKAYNEQVNEKLAKDSVEVEKKNLNATEILNTSLKDLTKIIKEQNKRQGDPTGQVGDKADKVKSYKGAGGAIKERVDDFKQLFTLRGFLDKTGIVKKGSTGFISGIADAALEKREAKQQYIADRKNVDKGYVKGLLKNKDADKVLGDTFEKGNDALIKVQDNNKAIAGLKERGFDAQVYRSTEGQAQAGLEADLSKKDSRFRGGIERSESGKPLVEKATPSKSSGGGGSNVIPLFKKEDKEQSVGIADAMSTSEEEIENARLMAAQTELLAQIEENTRGMGGGGDKKDDDKKKESGGILGKLVGGPMKFISGIVDSLMGVLASFGGMLMSGLSAAFKFLLNPKMLLKVFSKVLAPLAIVGALVNGIMDGFNAFMETGSIGEALIAGLGGILDFLTFGLIDAKVIRKVVDWVSGFVDEYIIEPITKFATFLGDAFNTYIAEPITAAFTMVGNLFTEYIVNPLKELFAPVADFFKNLKDQVFGFLEDFGIPEISFTIPIIDKKISIGPFYPFRPDSGVDKVSTGSEMTSKSSAAGESSNFKENTTVTNKNESTVVNSEDSGGLDANGKPLAYKSSRTIAKLDATTGKASYSREDADGNAVYDKELSNSAFRQIKKASKEGAGSDKIADIIKEDEAYQKLSWFDKRKVDVGYAKATELVPAEKGKVEGDMPKSANKVNADSKDVESGKVAPAPVVNTTVVSNNNSTNQKSTTAVAAPSPRNSENPANDYVRRRTF